MNITGTNKNDFLLGTSGDDFIDGRGGNDWIDGAGGNDTYHGGNGRDTFVSRQHEGVILIDDFVFVDNQNFNVDRVLFDWGGTYSDVMFLGEVSDGLVHTTGDATFTFNYFDYDGDGETDLVVTAESEGVEGTIVLLGISEIDGLTGAAFAGG